MSLSKLFGTKAQGTRTTLFNTIGSACPCRISSQFWGEKEESGAVADPWIFVFWYPNLALGNLTISEDPVGRTSDFSCFYLHKQIVVGGGKDILAQFSLNDTFLPGYTLSGGISEVSSSPPISHSHSTIQKSISNEYMSHFETRSKCAGVQIFYLTCVYFFCIPLNPADIATITISMFVSAINPYLDFINASAPRAAQPYHLTLPKKLDIKSKKQTKPRGNINKDDTT
jgi:hypothetical protein